MVSSEAKNSARAASSATSRAAPCVPSPISALAASTFLPSRPAMTTRAPAWWAALAVASPIPELPPITTTHASRSEPGISSSSGSRGVHHAHSRGYGEAMAASFGQLLRQHRVAASLTQEASADRCQLSPATIAALENGLRKAPRLSTVRDIAEALGLTPPDRAALAAAAGAPGGEAAFADVPARVETMTRSQRRSALPSPITPLIGRHVAVAELAQSVVVDRLVTLAGPGGVGKTRLALRAAAEAADKFPGGTCWVELGSVTDPDGVPLALLQSLGGSYHPAVQVEEQIGALLADDPMLFVVDNCEHVLDAAADSVGALLAHANVTVLATSREALAIPGEVVWPVPALAVPADDTPADDDSLAAFDSVQLFVERAARARPGFSLTVASAEPVARIARRLEGNPLAIELTAARMRVLPVEQLADEVDEAFSLTAGRARGVPGRQTTLWASIDWSYQLLAEDERWAFRCLAAFVGPFTAPAFAAVAGVASDDALATLAAKSLVSLASDGGYRVLDTIRSYAAEQAAAVGELERIKDAHAAHMVDWLASIGAGEATDETLDLIDAQYPNFRAALLWSIETRSPAAVALVGSFGVGWHQLSNFHDAIALGDAALEIAAEVDPPARPRLVGMLAMCRLLAGDSTFITTTLPQGAADAEAVGDQLARGWCQLIIGSRPPFDPAYLLDAYQLALAVESPMLAALAAASITYGGTEADNDDWLDRAA